MKRGSLLSEVSDQERDQGREADHDEERQARDSGYLPGLRHYYVPHREGLALPAPKRSGGSAERRPFVDLERPRAPISLQFLDERARIVVGDGRQVGLVETRPQDDIADAPLA